MMFYAQCTQCEAETFVEFHGGGTFPFTTEEGEETTRRLFPWNGSHYFVRDERVDVERLCRGAWQPRPGEFPYGGNTSGHPAVVDVG